MTLAPVEALLRERIGLDPGSLGPTVLARLVRSRMRQRGVTAAVAYVGLLATDPAEWSALLGELLVPESWFFRGGRALFDHLAGWLRARATSNPVRILSAPCSTGEEPYSLAIALDEQGVPPTAYRIDAVDLSADHLARAAAAVFPAFAFRETATDPRSRCFIPTADGRWELRTQFREAVRFLPGNLIDLEFLAGEPPYDLILCRNLFIYLTPEARTQAIANLDRLLIPDGRLCLTPAEADRLPPGRFAPDGPPALATFRRAGSGRVGRVTAIGHDGSTPGIAAVPAALPPGRTGVPPASSPTPPKSSRDSRDPRMSGLENSTRPTKTIPARPQVDPRVLADAGRLDEARAICERRIQTGPPSADLFALLGVIHLAAGRRTDAADALRKALYLDPDHHEALTHMIVVHEQRGEPERAAGLRRRLARVERRQRT
ncbi:MAG TPA: CheR family methyltransferase [Gemmataceae bacterium]|nr:CheR family methyltransferase [Gemmataceae bacterium]